MFIKNYLRLDGIKTISTLTPTLILYLHACIHTDTTDITGTHTDTHTNTTNTYIDATDTHTDTTNTHTDATDTKIDDTVPIMSNKYN